MSELYVLEFKDGFGLLKSGREMGSGENLRFGDWQGEDSTFLVIGASKTIKFHSVFGLFPIPSKHCEQDR